MTKEEFIKERSLTKKYVSASQDLPRSFYDRYDLYCKLSEFIKELQKIEKQLSEQENIKDIMFEQQWYGYETTEFSITYKRPETDDEFNLRIDKDYKEYVGGIVKKKKEKSEKRLSYEKELKGLKEKYSIK